MPSDVRAGTREYGGNPFINPGPKCRGRPILGVVHVLQGETNFGLEGAPPGRKGVRGAIGSECVFQEFGTSERKHHVEREGESWCDATSVGAGVVLVKFAFVGGGDVCFDRSVAPSAEGDGARLYHVGGV